MDGGGIMISWKGRTLLVNMLTLSTMMFIVVGLTEKLKI